MLECIERSTGTEPAWSVIWLHGLGADGNDFVPIVPELIRPGWPALRFVFPHAPVRPVTINGGMRMRAWYDILGMEIAQRQDAAGIRESIGQIEALIAREVERGIPAARIVLAGFSQGGAITLAAAVRHAARLGGAIALSTYLPMAETLPAESAPANRDLPILMAHGSRDPVVGEPLGTMSRDRLRVLGYPVEWRSYPMAHQVCAEEIADIAQWLGARFSA